MSDIWVCSLHRENTCKLDCLACVYYELKKIVDENDAAIERILKEIEELEEE